MRVSIKKNTFPSTLLHKANLEPLADNEAPGPTDWLTWQETSPIFLRVFSYDKGKLGKG